MDREERQRVGRMIKLARIELGMNQTDLGEAMDLSISSVAAYERGERPRFSRRMALAFEEALGITDRRLLKALGYEKPDPTPPDQRNTLSYEGDELAPEQEQDVLAYIEWVRNRRDRR